MMTIASICKFLDRVIDLLKLLSVECFVYRILDNLPVAVLWQVKSANYRKIYERGVRVGFKGKFAGVRIMFISFASVVLILFN